MLLATFNLPGAGRPGHPGADPAIVARRPRPSAAAKSSVSLRHPLRLAAGLLLAGWLCLPPALAAELKVAYDAGPETLDVQEQLTTGVLQLAHLSFDPLLRWTRELGFEPRLATRWERIDPLTMRFFLRRGVRFHSGNPLTAADFKFTFDRLRGSDDFARILADFNELRVVDDYTIDLVTSNPYPLVLHAATYLFALDREFYSGVDGNGNDKSAIVKNGESFASSRVSGSGPFRVVAREANGRIVFERFADYWDERSRGNVSRIVFTPIRDENARVDALLSGDVDLIAPVPSGQFERIRAADDAELVTIHGTRIVMLQMNQNRRPEFRRQRVRMAIVHAIDNDAIARDIMRGFATPAAQFSPPGYLGHNARLKPRHDLALARRLLQEAGYENGFRITLMAPEDRYGDDARVARAVADMLAKIGVEVELTTMSNAEYWPRFDDRAADLMMIGWRSETEDSANIFEFLAMTPTPDTHFGQYNSGNYSSEFVDATTLQAKQETDPEKRAELLREIETNIYQDAAFIPLYWQNLAWAARKGVNIEPVVNPLNLPYLGDLVVTGD